MLADFGGDIGIVALDAFVTVRRPVFLVDYERGGAVDRVDFPVLGVAPSAGVFFEFP